MARGPVGHTCPDIDYILSGIKSAQTELNGLNHILEELRSANDSLRTWSIEQEDRANELESERDSLQSALNEANNQINELEKQLNNE